MLVESGWYYYSSESEFVKYFDRLKSTGISNNEIRNKLTQLQKHYFEMVIKGIFYVNIPTLENLFNKWVNNFN